MGASDAPPLFRSRFASWKKLNLDMTTNLCTNMFTICTNMFVLCTNTIFIFIFFRACKMSRPFVMNVTTFASEERWALMLSPVFTFHRRYISTLTQLIVQPIISLWHATSKHRNEIMKSESLRFGRHWFNDVVWCSWRFNVKSVLMMYEFRGLWCSYYDTEYIAI